MFICKFQNRTKQPHVITLWIFVDAFRLFVCILCASATSRRHITHMTGGEREREILHTMRSNVWPNIFKMHSLVWLTQWSIAVVLRCHTEPYNYWKLCRKRLFKNRMKSIYDAQRTQPTFICIYKMFENAWLDRVCIPHTDMHIRNVSICFVAKPASHTI